MSVKELLELDDAALAAKIADFRQELFGLRFKQATGELENTAGLRNTKRELARALTVQGQRAATKEETA